MNKKLYQLAAALLTTSATLISAHAAAPVAVTNATVLENVTVTLTATEQGLYVTNKKGSLITAYVTNSSIDTKSTIKAIGAAMVPSNHFSLAAKLIRFTSYSRTTNAWEYKVSSTNTTAFGTNSTNFSLDLASTNSGISFMAPEMPSTNNTTNIEVVYPFVSNLGASNITLIGSPLAGVTNATTLALVSNVYILGKTMVGYEIIDGTNKVLLTNGEFYLGASFEAAAAKGTELAVNSNAVYDTETGTRYALGSSTMEGVSSNNLGFTCSLTGFETTSYSSQNAEPLKVGPEYFEIATSSLDAYGSGVQYFGTPTNFARFVVKGTVSTSLYKTILTP